MDFRGSLLNAGFRWLQSSDHKLSTKFKSLKGIKFVKRYTTNAGEFEVLLLHYQKDLTRLPYAYVIEKPARFDGVALPHIRNSGYLCYADNDQTQWNPLDEQNFAEAIDHGIAKSLETAVNNIESPEEYRNEFSNYWEADFTAFSFEALPTLTKKLRYCSLKVKNGRDVGEKTEFVVYSNEHQRDSWLKLRGKVPSIDDSTAMVVTIRPNNWAPVSEWPPSSFSEVVGWLAKADRSAHDYLIFQLVKIAAKRVLVVLQITGEGNLAFCMMFSTRHHKLLESWRNRKKNSLKSMIAPICSHKAIELFCRLRVEAVDHDAIFLRNRPKPEVGDLRNKRIALIGCGTIGGYVAELLVKSGAGLGPVGRLTLYDSDTLHSGNLARHRLPIRFLDWNKADGIAELIQEESLHRVSVHAKQLDFEISIENLKKYDLVIDATGRVPFSLALAGCMRTIGADRPILIHGFNYQWGQDSVAFIDDGQACYGCLEKLGTSNLNKPDFDTSRYSCGSIFTPYDANVSLISAALVVEAVLNTLEGKLKWTYSKVTGNNSKSAKRLLFKPWSECKVCGRGRT